MNHSFTGHHFNGAKWTHSNASLASGTQRLIDDRSERLRLRHLWKRLRLLR